MILLEIRIVFRSLIINKLEKNKMVDRQYVNPEVRPGVPPAMLFKYTAPLAFLTVAEGFLKKYNWESRLTLTTVHDVKQLDDDRVVIYRRHQLA